MKSINLEEENDNNNNNNILKNSKNVARIKRTRYPLNVGIYYINI